MKKALILVDLQQDFCSPFGALPVPGAEQAVENTRELVRDSIHSYDALILTRDWHPANHSSFKPAGQWPVHCVQNSTGAQFHPQIELMVQEVCDTTPTFIVSKGFVPEAEQYSAFNGPVFINDHGPHFLRDLLRAKEIQCVDIAGVAFEYCVGNTALGAEAQGFIVKVLQPATAYISFRNSQVMAAKLHKRGISISNAI